MNIPNTDRKAVCGDHRLHQRYSMCLVRKSERPIKWQAIKRRQRHIERGDPHSKRIPLQNQTSKHAPLHSYDHVLIVFAAYTTVTFKYERVGSETSAFWLVLLQGDVLGGLIHLTFGLRIPSTL